MNRERTSSASVLLHIYEDEGKWGSGPPFSISHRFPSWYGVSLLDGWKQVPFWQPPTPPCPAPPPGPADWLQELGARSRAWCPAKSSSHLVFLLEAVALGTLHLRDVLKQIRHPDGGVKLPGLVGHVGRLSLLVSVWLHQAAGVAGHRVAFV